MKNRKAALEVSLISRLNSYLKLFLFIVSAVTFSYAQSNLVALHTSEFEQYRRIMIHIPQKASNTVNLPALRENPSAGKLQITIYNISQDQYLGPSIIRETGAYPIRIKIAFPENETMQITVETIPYQQLTAFNVFGSEQFIFDIYKIRPSESLLLENSVSLYPGAAMSGENKAVSSSFELSWTARLRYLLLKHGSGRIMDAFFYSGLIIAAITFLGLIWLFLKKQKQLPQQVSVAKSEKKVKQNPTPVTPPKPAVPQVTQAPESPFVPLTPADKENMIRELMQKEGISYDEATILVSLSKGKLNVSV
jgi:hypothetical protein